MNVCPIARVALTIISHSRRYLGFVFPVGLHAIGFLGDTTEQAADDFYPGYAHTFTEIGKGRGWPPATRAQFDALRGPTAALLIGEAEAAAEKIVND